MDFKIISQGAEGKIVKIDKNTLEKVRDVKPYRLEIIDTKLRKNRNRREFKILNKLYDAKINVPKPFEIIEKKEKKEFSFTFEYLKGENLKTCLNKKLLFKVFEEIIKMHNLNIIHGDLTTLNMMNVKKEVFLIDFGLSEVSNKFEEKGVDLNLFFNCIKNEHPEFYKFKVDLIKIYLKKAENSNSVLERLRNIEKRGRNK